jgi:hypothetical protein
MLTSFLIAALISLGLIVVSVVVFYEILAHLWLYLPKLEGMPRTQILVTILACFLGHTIVVWLFGLTYYGLEHHLEFGSFKGAHTMQLMDYIYFSGVAYSSLGLGDMYPTGDMRLMIAVEVILGLILIGWTITITYFATEKYLIHKQEKHGRKRS